jgi:hypothetical protein
MKNLVLVLALAISTGTFAQLEVQKAPETVIHYKNISLTSLIEFRSDSTSHFAIYYRNAKYQHITDIKYLSFSNRAELDQFFELSLKVIDTKEEFRTSKYSLKKMMKNVFVINENGSYFYLSGKAIGKMQESLNSEHEQK